MKTSPIIVNEIRRLSQEEGLKDHEIAEIIEYNRVSIQRIRKENHIPTCNLLMRKDKEVICNECGRIYTIRRCEEEKPYCPECMAALHYEREQSKKFDFNTEEYGDIDG